jgi:hypothetical protein
VKDASPNRTEDRIMAATLAQPLTRAAYLPTRPALVRSAAVREAARLVVAAHEGVAETSPLATIAARVGASLDQWGADCGDLGFLTELLLNCAADELTADERAACGSLLDDERALSRMVERAAVILRAHWNRCQRLAADLES